MRVPFLDLGAATRELRGELDAAYRRVMDSGRYILGEEVERFEAEFARYCGARHCVAVGNGLDALYLILAGHGIGAGGEVLVAANTFIATWLAVSRAGAVPVPVEPDPRTFNLDPERIAAAVTPRTRAVLATHLYGQPADIPAVRKVAERFGLRVYEDAAQAHGSRLRGRRAGTLGDAAAFSFYPTKNLGAWGDGGAVVTDDGDLAERVRLLRNYGAARKNEHELVGVNSRLDPLQAAFLCVRLACLDAWNAQRREVAARYAEALSDLPALTLPGVLPGTEPAWHLFVVRHPRRDLLRERLAAGGVESLVHYPTPPHRSRAYAATAGGAALPLTEELAATVLSLPVSPHLTPAMQETVIAAVRAAV